MKPENIFFILLFFANNILAQSPWLDGPSSGKKQWIRVYQRDAAGNMYANITTPEKINEISIYIKKSILENYKVVHFNNGENLHKLYYRNLIVMLEEPDTEILEKLKAQPALVALYKKTIDTSNALIKQLIEASWYPINRSNEAKVLFKTKAECLEQKKIKKRLYYVLEVSIAQRMFTRISPEVYNQDTNLFSLRNKILHEPNIYGSFKLSLLEDLYIKDKSICESFTITPIPNNLDYYIALASMNNFLVNAAYSVKVDEVVKERKEKLKNVEIYFDTFQLAFGKRYQTVLTTLPGYYSFIPSSYETIYNIAEFGQQGKAFFCIVPYEGSASTGLKYKAAIIEAETMDVLYSEVIDRRNIKEAFIRKLKNKIVESYK
jgi:hypothetical protein